MKVRFETIRADRTKGPTHRLGSLGLIALFLLAACSRPAPTPTSLSSHEDQAGSLPQNSSGRDRFEAKIRFGTPDTGHPYVVALEIGPFGLCSGSLLNATTILTAGHCLFGLQPSNTVVNAVAEFEGAVEYARAAGWTIHPEYIHNASVYSPDLAVVELEKPITLVKSFGVLPSENVVKNLLPGDLLDIVGFGVIGKKSFDSKFYGKHLGRSEFVGVQYNQLIAFPAPIQKQSNHKQDAEKPPKVDRKSGTLICPGDSGGPLLSGDTILGVASSIFRLEKPFPNDPSRACRKADFSAHVSTFAYADWIKSTCSAVETGESNK